MAANRRRQDVRADDPSTALDEDSAAPELPALVRGWFAMPARV
ncbi:hypothetical protein [Microbispora rosea]